MGMRQHSQRRRAQRNSRRTTPRRPTRSGRQADSGFLGAWQQLLGNFRPVLGKRRGRKPRVPLPHLLATMVFHLMNSAESLAEHFAMLCDDPLADSSCASRQARLPWIVFADLMQRRLRPLAQKRRHPTAFWRGWRLRAMDGTQCSWTNTPQVKRATTTAKSRRGRAALAKIHADVLLEIGLHNPLAAAIGRQGEAEWPLARRLVAQLPKAALLLADRLHGCAAFAWELLPACQRVGSHFLIRARTAIRTHTVARLPDGSRIVLVAVRQKGKLPVIVEWLEFVPLSSARDCGAPTCGSGPVCWTRLRHQRWNWWSCMRPAGNRSCSIGH